MKKVLLVAVIALLATALVQPAHAQLPAPRIGEAVVIAFGGTPVSNGIFFPGTRVCQGNDADDCTTLGPPVQVPRGSDLTFVNLDHSAVANFHTITSFKRDKRTRRPLFQSDEVHGPAQVTVKTAHLKPGVYHYFCGVHFGMLGTLEVVDS